MKNLRKLALGTVTGGLMSIGLTAMVVAQTTTAPRIDVDFIAQEMNLSPERERELAPLLERLNAVLEQREQHWREGDEILQELDSTYDQIEQTLTATELRDFYWLMRGAAVGGWSDRPMNRYMTGGRAWGGYGLRQGMRGGRGYYGRGVPLRGTRGYAGRGIPMRGVRGGMGWNTPPGWIPDEYDPKD